MTVETASLEEQHEIIELARAIDQHLHDHRGDIVLSALMSCVMNVAVQMPPQVRPEMCKDIRDVVKAIESMGDAMGDEAHARARAANENVFTDEPGNLPPGATLQ